MNLLDRIGVADRPSPITNRDPEGKRTLFDLIGAVENERIHSGNERAQYPPRVIFPGEKVSTCRGCWRDENVPGDVGVLMTVAGDWVLHPPSPLCSAAEPHRMGECLEFEAPRDTVERDPDPPPHPTRSPGWNYLKPHQWETFFTFKMNAFAWLGYVVDVRGSVYELPYNERPRK